MLDSTPTQPQSTPPQVNAGQPLPPPQPNEPSCPVVIDPMGYYARGGGTNGVGTPLGDNGAAQIPRVNLTMIESYANTPLKPITVPPTFPDPKPLAQRLCSNLDGLSYDEDGAVPTNNPATMRELRYNWMWVVQRPVNRDKNTLRMQVVVFDKRAHMFAPRGAEAVFHPVITNPGNPVTGTRTGPTFIPGETAITNVPAAADIRKGSWVMDATLLNQGDPTQNAKSDNDGTVAVPVLVARTLRHAEFYRVLSVTDAGNNTQTLEVHRPISRPDGKYSAANPAAYQYFGTLVVMPTVTDVFERNQMTAATGQ